MKLNLARILACALLASAAYAAPGLVVTDRAEAAQAWYCICKGEKKRFLASTRHCEFKMKIAKGEFCTKDQYKTVYGPACAEKGCTLAPLD